jgi:hypothetical protein
VGFFTKPDASAPSDLGPLSLARLQAVLDAQGVHYKVDEDGDLGGIWDGHVFFFFRVGSEESILQIRGRWDRKVGLEHLADLAAETNKWNVERLWPKAYVRTEGDVVGVYGEVSVEYRAGASDEQIDLQFQIAVSTTLDLFEELDKKYPEAAAAARAEDEEA